MGLDGDSENGEGRTRAVKRIENTSLVASK